MKYVPAVESGGSKAFICRIISECFMSPISGILCSSNALAQKKVWPRSRLQSRAGKSVCKGGEYPLLLYVLRFTGILENVHVGANNVL